MLFQKTKINNKLRLFNMTLSMSYPENREKKRREKKRKPEHIMYALRIVYKDEKSRTSSPSR